MTGAAAEPAAALVRRLAERGWTIGVAESLTGGLVVSSLVSVPGASAVLRGGVVAYATDLKRTLLGVDADLLAAEGAVHPEVARQMAEGVRGVVGPAGGRADLGVATTGVAGPDPQDGHPVGTVYIAVVSDRGARVEELSLRGGRAEIRAESASRSIRLALDTLLE